MVITPKHAFFLKSFIHEKLTDENSFCSEHNLEIILSKYGIIIGVHRSLFWAV